MHFCITVFSQDITWSQSQIDLLKEKGVSIDDHRGIILVPTFNPSLEICDVIDSQFFSGELMDIKKLEITYDPKDEKYYNRPLNLFEVTTLYLMKK